MTDTDDPGVDRHDPHDRVAHNRLTDADAGGGQAPPGPCPVSACDDRSAEYHAAADFSESYREALDLLDAVLDGDGSACGWSTTGGRARTA